MSATPPRTLDPTALHGALRGAAAWLDANREALNAINIYPVPDGDTGTNMTLTLGGALDAAEDGTASFATYAAALARGALFAARGNSGVILSQMLRGLVEALPAGARDGTVDGGALAGALRAAAAAADAAVGAPVEGTMLTVLRDAAAAAEAAAGEGLAAVLSAAEGEALQSVQRTPALLPALRAAGVVDAGGLGVAVLLGGLRAACLGQPLPPPPAVARPAAAPGGGAGPAGGGRPADDGARDDYGYCCEFVITPAAAGALDRAAIAEALAQTGGASLLVVGDATALHVHVHLDDPGPALSAGVAHGELRAVKVEHMHAQHREWLAAQDPAPPPLRPGAPAAAAAAVGLVAVAPGPGLGRAFEELGATVVAGGPTANPSTGDLVRAAAATGAAVVVLLPNDPNVLSAAEQAAATDPARLRVVAARSVPAGLAAAVAYRPQGPADAVVAAMRAALAAVHPIAVTRAVRSATVDGLPVRAGEALALLDGTAVATAEAEVTALAAACRVLAERGVTAELVTVYLGAGATAADGTDAAAAAAAVFPQADVVVVAGGQPHYTYLVGVE